MSFLSFTVTLWSNFEATKSDRNFRKIEFCGEQWFQNDQFGGVKRPFKFLVEAGKFRLVISELKITSGMNHKLCTHQKYS